MTALTTPTADELRQRLVAAREDLIGHIRSRLAGSDAPGAIALREHLDQPDDMSQAIETGDNEMALLDQEQTLLREIDASLARLDAGIGNICIVCGDEISESRLLANPTAKTCIACQQAIEKNTHVPHSPTI